MRLPLTKPPSSTIRNGCAASTAPAAPPRRPPLPTRRYYFSRIVDMADADSTRPEMIRAREYLAGK
jgi:hypothetical protein